MKLRFHRFLPFLWIAAVPAGAAAQNKIDPQVEVTRDFEGKLLEIHKSRLRTDFSDTLNRFQLNFNYSIFDKPYKDLYEFSPLPSARLQSPVDVRRPVFGLRAGAGVPLAPFGDIWFQPRLGNRHTLLLQAGHESFWGKLPLAETNESMTRPVADKSRKIPGDRMSNRAGIHYGYSWEKGDLSLDLFFRNHYAAYYGIGGDYFDRVHPGNHSYLKNNLSHTWNQIGAAFDIRSTGHAEKKSKFNYRLNIDYLHTADTPSDELFPDRYGAPALLLSRQKEDRIRVEGEFGPTFGRYSRLTIGISSETAFNNGIRQFHRGLADIIPQYKFEKNRWTLHAGIRISVHYSSLEQAGKYHQILFPKADLSYEIARRHLWAYASADGRNRLNDHASLLEECNWIAPAARLQTGSVPVLLKAGIRGTAAGKFGYDLGYSYTVHKGLLQFINSGESLLDALYSNHRESALSASLTWDSKHVSAGTRFRYRTFTKSKKESSSLGYSLNPHAPFGYAPVEWYTYVQYNWRERIIIGADALYRNAAPMCISDNSLPGTYLYENFKSEPYLNLGIRIEYAFNNRFSIFVRGTNLLNETIVRLPGYIEPGIGVQGGVFITL